jgi:hypothetical protein
MKRIFLIILVAASVAACKKDGSGSGGGKLLLSKIIFNGLLHKEYTYNTDGKIIRIDNYLTGGGQSTLSSYWLYQYNNEGRISESVFYLDDHVAISKDVYSYSAQGKLTRLDEAVSYDSDKDLNVVDFFSVFNYNGSGQLTKMTRRENNYTMDYYTDYTYDDKGYLATYESWHLDDGDMVLKQKTEINAGTKPMPDHWKALLLTPTDLELYKLYITGYKYTSYWSGPAGNVSNTSYLNRQYNDQGYVIKETWKSESFGTVNENELTYEYVQL